MGSHGRYAAQPVPIFVSLRPYKTGTAPRAVVFNGRYRQPVFGATPGSGLEARFIMLE